MSSRHAAYKVLVESAIRASAQALCVGELGKHTGNLALPREVSRWEFSDGRVFGGMDINEEVLH